jgi:20S proteasome subunit beta 7
MISSSPNSSSSSSFRLLNPFDRTNPRNNLISEVESMDIAEPVAESIDREVVEHCRLLVGLRLSNLYVIFLRCPDEDPNCAALNTLSCESKASVDFRRGDSSSQLSPSSSIGDKTLIGASGEISDFQSIMEMLDNMHQQDVNQDDGFTRTPAEIHSYLRAILYNRRNKGDPLWNQILVAGLKNDAPFLGYVDLIGTCYEENFVATGFGAYLAIPLIREKWDAQMSEGEARDLLEDCLRVLFYRDCRASNRIILAKVTKDGPIVSEPYELTTDWETANYDVRHAVPGLSAVDGSSW